MTAAYDHSDFLPAPPRHLKVTGAFPAFGFEPCEDVGCVVSLNGRTSSCGRQACPSCGCGGTNLVTIRIVDSQVGVGVRCTCGNSWVREGAPDPVATPKS